VSEPLGSPAHQALIAHVVTYYAGDDRIRAVAVFGSVGAGTWHELSDVDFDVVTEDGARVDPGAEIAALFGPRAVIVLAGTDAADVVLGSREELSIRWHPLSATGRVTAPRRHRPRCRLRAEGPGPREALGGGRGGRADPLVEA
jgi:hypothetical protein